MQGAACRATTEREEVAAKNLLISEKAGAVRGYPGGSTAGGLRSTGRNEPSGLSTIGTAKRRIANVIGAGYAGCDHGSLHPQRPSGRSPHRPLTFFAAPDSDRDRCRFLFRV